MDVGVRIVIHYQIKIPIQFCNRPVGWMGDGVTVISFVVTPIRYISIGDVFNASFPTSGSTVYNTLA